MQTLAVDLNAYIPIGIIVLMAIGFAIVNLVGTHILGPRRGGATKEIVYESGMNPIGSARKRFNVRFYILAMTFLVFDVEIIFLFAWASVWQDLGWFGVAAVGLFTALIAETLSYVWKRGALDWNEPRRARYRVEETSVEEAA